MEVIGKLQGEPIKDMDGNNLVVFNIGKDDKTLHKIFNDFNEKNLLITLQKYRKKRSNEANRYFWKCISILAAGLENDNWDQYLTELERYGKFISMIIRQDAYADLQNMWRETKITGERRDKDGQIYYDVNCYYGSSTYDSAEFSRLLNGVIEDIKDAGLDIPIQ